MREKGGVYSSVSYVWMTFLWKPRPSRKEIPLLRIHDGGAAGNDYRGSNERLGKVLPSVLERHSSILASVAEQHCLKRCCKRCRRFGHKNQTRAGEQRIQHLKFTGGLRGREREKRERLVVMDADVRRRRSPQSLGCPGK